ncbi:Uncharacterised protein [Mesomycoplasma hyorhinis]|nr:Uncharacterised protein [Mesomycoplasma hyorhinis]
MSSKEKNKNASSSAFKAFSSFGVNSLTFFAISEEFKFRLNVFSKYSRVFKSFQLLRRLTK